MQQLIDMMKKAVISDKKLVTDIISESFNYNPSVISAIKPGEKQKKQRLNGLAEYAFKTALRRNGVFISSDRKGVAICYRYNEKKESIIDYWNQLVLVIKSIGISRIFKLLKRESYIKKMRPESGNYLYFWFFGVAETGRGQGAATELKDAIFREAENKNLPIYLETSVEKNKIVYERYGFEVYHIQKNNNMTLWFMRRKQNNTADTK